MKEGQKIYKVLGLVFAEYEITKITNKTFTLRNTEDGTSRAVSYLQDLNFSEMDSLSEYRANLEREWSRINAKIELKRASFFSKDELGVDEIPEIKIKIEEYKESIKK